MLKMRRGKYVKGSRVIFDIWYDPIHVYIYAWLYVYHMCIIFTCQSWFIPSLSSTLLILQETIRFSRNYLALKRRHHLGFGQVFNLELMRVASCRCVVAWTTEATTEICALFILDVLLLHGQPLSDFNPPHQQWLVFRRLVICWWSCPCSGKFFLYATRELDKILWILPTDLKIRCPFGIYSILPLLSDPFGSIVFFQREEVQGSRQLTTATKRGSELPAGSAASAFTALRQVLGAPLSDGGPRPLQRCGHPVDWGNGTLRGSTYF